MSIQHDPARRIRRIRRWLTEYAGIPEFDVLLIGDDGSLHDQRVFELMRLAGLEIDWLCKYANVAEKTEDILTEQHDQALGEVLRLQQTIAEQKARIEELETRRVDGATFRKQVTMTQSEHEKERRAFWDACYLIERKEYSFDSATMHADRGLTEHDKRFPAPGSEEK